MKLELKMNFTGLAIIQYEIITTTNMISTAWNIQNMHYFPPINAHKLKIFLWALPLAPLCPYT